MSEIIPATSATVDGQTTAHYIAERLEHFPVQVTRLAHGVPFGGELNYLDDGTLAQAMKAEAAYNRLDILSAALIFLSSGSKSACAGKTGSGGVSETHN